MAKRALSWKRAGAIGWRDLKSAPGKFGFVVLSVAVGVAALVGVRGFSESFKRTLSTEARSLMAGDLSARIFRQPTAEESGKIEALDRQGIRTTWVTETISMASVPPDPVPLLVSLKAVDPGAYPFYGKAELEPAMSLNQALDGDSAVVAEEFLIRLNAGRSNPAARWKELSHLRSITPGAGPHHCRSRLRAASDDFSRRAWAHSLIGAGQPGQRAAAGEAAG